VQINASQGCTGLDQTRQQGHGQGVGRSVRYACQRKGVVFNKAALPCGYDQARIGDDKAAQLRQSVQAVCIDIPDRHGSAKIAGELLECLGVLGRFGAAIQGLEPAISDETLEKTLISR